MKIVKLHKITTVQGVYDDCNHQRTTVFDESGNSIVSYDQTYYPPYSYGATVKIDNSKTFDKTKVERKNNGKDGVTFIIYPPHGINFVWDNKEGI